jgi:hypothetical protein
MTQNNLQTLDNNIYTENAIRTFTGKVFDLKILDPESICIQDIAHALSHVPRFAGHLQNHYSVAQHSVLVSLLVPKEHRLAALLHDASEAYIGDMPTPFKKLMPDYKKLEENLMKAIADKFGFQFPFHPSIKQADAMLLNLEWKSFVLKNGTLEYGTSEIYKQRFLDSYYELVNTSNL